MTLVPAMTFGQESYKPLLEEGKVWTYHYYNDMTGREFNKSLTVSGDTIIDNKNYKRIVDVETERLDCVLREEDKKVFVSYPNYSGETLLYDFGLNEGDSFPLDGGDGANSSVWTVVSVDTIVVGGHAYRALDVRPKGESWPNWWVEGIGGMYYLTANIQMVGNDYSFYLCQLDGETLFTDKDFQILGDVPSSSNPLPMVVEGRKWNVVTINPAYPSEATNGYYDVLGRRGKVWDRFTYVLEGDTIIGGVTYKRLLLDGKYVCGLREEDGRVYKRGNNSEGLLYDFNAQPGDIFKNDECSWMQVGQVRQVSVKGQNRRCLDMYYYSCIGDPEEGEELVVIGGYYVADYWIEGIGCTGYPHNLFWFDIIGNYPLLVSVYDGDKCIFDIEEFGSIVATSVRDIPKATNERNISPDAPIYDLQGRRLSAMPQKGVYIQNGKKKLVK